MQARAAGRRSPCMSTHRCARSTAGGTAGTLRDIPLPTRAHRDCTHPCTSCTRNRTEAQRLQHCLFQGVSSATLLAPLQHAAQDARPACPCRVAQMLPRKPLRKPCRAAAAAPPGCWAGSRGRSSPPDAPPRRPGRTRCARRARSPPSAAAPAPTPCASSAAQGGAHKHAVTQRQPMQPPPDVRRPCMGPVG